MTVQSRFASNLITPELSKAASAESLDIWQNPESILDMCEIRYDEGTLRGVPDSRIGRRLHVSELGLLGTRPTLAGFAQDFPALGEVLHTLREAEYADLEIQHTEFLRGFSINYLFPGQWLNLHRDIHRKRDTPFGAIATLAILQGEGETYIQSQSNNANSVFTRIRSREGNGVAFVNPSGPEENRPRHTATAIGRDLRINIGLQIPILSQNTH